MKSNNINTHRKILNLRQKIKKNPTSKFNELIKVKGSNSRGAYLKIYATSVMCETITQKHFISQCSVLKTITGIVIG